MAVLDLNTGRSWIDRMTEAGRAAALAALFPLLILGLIFGRELFSPIEPAMRASLAVILVAGAVITYVVTRVLWGRYLSPRPKKAYWRTAFVGALAVFLSSLLTAVVIGLALGVQPSEVPLGERMLKLTWVAAIISVSFMPFLLPLGALVAVIIRRFQRP